MTNYEYQDLCEELPMETLRDILEEILSEEILNKDKEHVKDQVINHYVSLISDSDVKDYLREDDRIGEYATNKKEELSQWQDLNRSEMNLINISGKN